MKYEITNYNNIPNICNNEFITLFICNKKSLHMRLPDQGVNLLCLDVIHFLHCILNLFLISTQVNNEDQSVVILNFLHGWFSGEWELQDLVVIKFIPWGGTNPRVFGVSILSLGLWAVESDSCSDLLRLLLYSRAWLDCLGSFQGLCLWISLLLTWRIKNIKSYKWQSPYYFILHALIDSNILNKRGI